MMLALLCILSVSGWDVVTEVSAGGYCTGTFMDETGDYHVVMVDQGTRWEITYNTSGTETGRTELPEPADPAFSFNLTLSDNKEGYGSFVALQCASSDDTLFSTALGEVSYSAELPGRVLPAEDGGCYITYTPAQAEGHWKLFRLNSAGEILFDNGFALSGGPVISINDMLELPGGGVVLTGVTDDCGMNLYMVLLGYDGAGNPLFYHREPFRFHGSGELLAIDEAGNIVVGGITGTERDDGYFMPPADTDVFLICYSSSGEEQWRTAIELPLQNRPSAMSIGPEGEIVLAVSSYREDGEGERYCSLIEFHPLRAGFAD